MSEISHQILLPYQLRWAKQFESEKVELLKIFNSKAIAIEHIGSTAISGLTAKDIVDIGVLIKHHKDADNFFEPLKQFGYTFHSSSTERHFYRKGDPIQYHLSIAYGDQGGFWKRQVLFRDYLHTHPDIRNRYAKLKEKLLQEDPTGMATYIEGKKDFVTNVLRSAGWIEM